MHIIIVSITPFAPTLAKCKIVIAMGESHFWANNRNKKLNVFCAFVANAETEPCAQLNTFSLKYSTKYCMHLLISTDSPKSLAQCTLRSTFISIKFIICPALSQTSFNLVRFRWIKFAKKRLYFTRLLYARRNHAMEVSRFYTNLWKRKVSFWQQNQQ